MCSWIRAGAIITWVWIWNGKRVLRWHDIPCLELASHVSRIMKHYMQWFPPGSLTKEISHTIWIFGDSFDSSQPLGPFFSKNLSGGPLKKHMRWMRVLCNLLSLLSSYCLMIKKQVTKFDRNGWGVSNEHVQCCAQWCLLLQRLLLWCPVLQVVKRKMAIKVPLFSNRVSLLQDPRSDPNEIPTMSYTQTSDGKLKWFTSMYERTWRLQT